MPQQPKLEHCVAALARLAVALRAVPAKDRLAYSRQLRTHAEAIIAGLPPGALESPDLSGTEWSAIVTDCIADALDASVDDDADGLLGDVTS